MEYPTLITTGGPFWASRSPGRAFDGLVLHELAHQWFYGLVASDEHSWPFLDEGLTTFVTGRALEALHPGAPILAGTGLGIGAWDRSSGKRARHRQAVASPAGSYATGSDYADWCMRARRLCCARSTAPTTAQRPAPSSSTRGVIVSHTPRRASCSRRCERRAATRRVNSSDSGSSSERTSTTRWSRSRVAPSTTGYEVEALLRRAGSLSLPVEVELTLETASACARSGTHASHSSGCAARRVRRSCVR
jgi:hypothetical protein